MMTATPIPRTLALTVYGDLDISWIREKPRGRAPIQTRVMRERDRMKVYDQIRRTLTAGQQAYLIYPLVENSDKLDLRSSTDMYERLRREVFPDFKLGLLHGRMKSEQKEEVLNRFKAGQIQLLISTTVIEVGIDVPNATLMVIEHPERLGLSQLHQLRGRVGRGSAVSHCVLLCDEFVTQRLRIMEKTEDGFEIAEEDMRLRGPGEFLGTRQSGLPGFRVGHIVRDAALLRIAREEAQALLKADPNLEAPENALIKKMVLTRWKDKIERLGDG
jgi:ATP-dependent DNA helicase RecG